MMRVPVKFDDLLLAFEFVSAGQLCEHEAYLCVDTGEFHYRSDIEEEDLPDDIENEERYIAIPDKSDFDLGSRLALRFADDVLPEDAAAQVHDIFRRKGAYARFKDLLASRGLLEQWYQFEEQRTNEALRDWCGANEIEIEG